MRPSRKRNLRLKLVSSILDPQPVKEQPKPKPKPDRVPKTLMPPRYKVGHDDENLEEHHILRASIFACRAIVGRSAIDGLAVFCGCPQVKSTSYCEPHRAKYMTGQWAPTKRAFKLQKVSHGLE
jgi:hypothetical protein